MQVGEDRPRKSVRKDDQPAADPASVHEVAFWSIPHAIDDHHQEKSGDNDEHHVEDPVARPGLYCFHLGKRGSLSPTPPPCGSSPGHP